MRESRTYGSVRGACSNGRPYRDPNTQCGRSSVKITLCIIKDSRGEGPFWRASTTRLLGRVWTRTRATWVLVSSALGSIVSIRPRP